MTIVSIKTKEPKERGNMTCAVPSLLLASEQQYLTYVIALAEAPDRQRLAEAITPVIGCIDGITQDLYLLVTLGKEIPPDLPTSNNSRPCKRTVRKC
jgi:hypothetical protein